MFKIFLTFLFFFIEAGTVYAQIDFSASKDEQEKSLNKYINASAVCAKMTDVQALYERGMLLLSDANEEAYIAAADCFTSAAMKNHTPSQLELGKLYEKGKGVTQNTVYAYKWLQTAVLLGNQDAIPFRNKLEARMTLDEIMTANPMIQSTLDLIELIAQREEEDLVKLEGEIAQKYRDFGVDISEYDIREESTTSNDNPLILTLIKEQRDKQAKAEAQQKAKKKGEQGVEQPEEVKQQEPALEPNPAEERRARRKQKQRRGSNED